jgi:hypothetical protein
MGFLINPYAFTSAVPAVNITDDFNRADDAAGLGTATTGQAWSTNQGIIGIQSNKAHTYTLGSGRANSTIDAAVADLTIQVAMTALATNGTIGGIVFRYVDNSNYWRFTDNGSSSRAAILAKIVAGSTSELINTATTINANSVLKVVLAGNSISVYVDNVQVSTTQTDSFNATATKHGLFSSGGTPTMDNFSMAN